MVKQLMIFFFEKTCETLNQSKTLNRLIHIHWKLNKNVYMSSRKKCISKALTCRVLYSLAHLSERCVRFLYEHKQLFNVSISPFSRSTPQVSSSGGAFDVGLKGDKLKIHMAEAMSHKITVTFYGGGCWLGKFPSQNWH